MAAPRPRVTAAEPAGPQQGPGTTAQSAEEGKQSARIPRASPSLSCAGSLAWSGLLSLPTHTSMATVGDTRAALRPGGWRTRVLPSFLLMLGPGSQRGCGQAGDRSRDGPSPGGGDYTDGPGAPSPPDFGSSLRTPTRDPACRPDGQKSQDRTVSRVAGHLCWPRSGVLIFKETVACRTGYP